MSSCIVGRAVLFVVLEDDAQLFEGTRDQCRRFLVELAEKKFQARMKKRTGAPGGEGKKGRAAPQPPPSESV